MSTDPNRVDPPDWPDLAGRLQRTAEGTLHRLGIRVYFEDTDFSDPPLL